MVDLCVSSFRNKCRYAFTCRLLCIAILSSSLPQRCNTQTYNFERTKVPLNKTLQTPYAFYVFSRKDAPGGGVATPYVQFGNLRMSSETISMSALSKYNSIEIMLVRYSIFWKYVSPFQFCSDSDDVSANRAKRENVLMLTNAPDERKQLQQLGIFKTTVNSSAELARSGTTPPIPIRTTGVFLMAISNCGDLQDIVIDGQVTVKNSYGFLPGNEYYKMPFYGWLIVIYLVLAAIWIFLSLRWWKQLFNIHHCIAVVILFGLLEAFMLFIFLHAWNSSGLRSTFLFVLSTLFAVAKSCFSYMLVLAASLGWGVTRPFLDSDSVKKIQVLSFSYIVLGVTRETVLSYRQSHNIEPVFIMLILLPSSLMNAGIFYWIFTALPDLMQSLEERKQTVKLALFRKLWGVLVFSVSVATLAVLFQVFNFSRNPTANWKSQWLLIDGVSHSLFVFVLIAMMWLWAPHHESQSIAFSQQVSTEMTSDIWGGNSIVSTGDDDIDKFWDHNPKDPRDVDIIGSSR